MDGKIFLGAMLTAGSVATTWIEQANEIGQLVLTTAGVMVAVLTAIYTAIRIRKLIEDKDGDD